MQCNLFLTAAACFSLSVGAYAEQLKYQPINPAFGGNPFNGSNLLSTASAQRGSAPVKKRDAMADFSSGIQSTLLSRISRDISDAILGEDAKQSGTFSVGGTQIDFHRDGANVVIDIKDPTQGSTTITMPVPTY